MCGITGILNLGGKPVSRSQLEKMTRSLAHRGPDGEGLHIDSAVGLGHRRLKIIDLSDSAKQPMQTEDGRFTMVYNGEIYNFLEIRRELKKAGHSFQSRSDSEVFLKAFAHWGPNCFEKFNGMFAVAIHDRILRKIFLARDRYGIKPLYYFRNHDKFMFASEVKGLLASGDVKPKMNLFGLVEYMNFQNFLSENTLFENIKLFPPGCWLEIPTNAGPKQLVFQRYWDFQFEEPSEKVNEAEILEELDRLFQQAVSRQLVSDVEIGSYLSGGIDSGSITALAAMENPYIKTFTCGFDLTSASGVELNFDERVAAEHMSYKFKTEHYEMVLKAGDMERILPKYSWHLEEPRVGQSYPNYYAAKLASKFVKVVLSGTGGDEAFGGYPWRYYRAVINNDFDHYIEKYFKYWQRLLPEDSLKTIFRPIWADVADLDTREIFRSVFATHNEHLTRPEDYVNHSLYFEAKTFLHGLLIVEDKLSMAHSLETRVPFLDNDLIDLATRIPARLKLGNLSEVVSLNENEPGSKTARYFQKTQDGKLILRRLMSRYVPEIVVNREKQGFSAPDSSWFKGDSIEYVKNLLLNPEAAIYEFLDREECYRLINQHLTGQANRRLLIWSLLNLEHWNKTFA